MAGDVVSASMRSALSHHLSNLRGTSGGRRIVSMTLVVAIHALMLLLLLRVAPPIFPMKPRSGPLVVTFLPNEQDTAEKTEQKQQKQERRRAASPRPTSSPVTARPAPVASDASIWTKVLPLTSEQFAASDISKMPSRPANADSEGADGGAGAGSSSAVVGGFRGEALYAADWYRPPSDAELSAYLPRNAPRVGWGMIACRTASNFRVEDCEEIGQYPPGSGFAGAVRQAAWQFRVLPPRIGGKAQIGVWVRIRIDYTEKGMGMN